jgi:hypothetical protein
VTFIEQPPVPSCSNCRYFHRIINPQDLSEVAGACRRHPPTAMAIPTGPGTLNIQGFFPPVRGELICGEHATQVPMSVTR